MNIYLVLMSKNKNLVSRSRETPSDRGSEDVE